jgi:hypothetical protein
MAVKGTAITEVEQLGNEITREVDDQGCLFITARGVVIQVTVRTNIS